MTTGVTQDQHKAARIVAVFYLLSFITVVSVSYGIVESYGGRIALASWTPDGFVGEMLRTVGRHLAPPRGLASPSRWGTRTGLDELLGAEARALRVEERTFSFRYRSAAHFVEVFRSFYGPIHRAYAALPPEGQAALTADLTALLERCDAGRGGGLVVPATYLEAVVTRA